MRVLGLTPSAIGLPLVTVTKKTGEREGLVADHQDENGGSYCKLPYLKGPGVRKSPYLKGPGVRKSPYLKGTLCA